MPEITRRFPTLSTSNVNRKLPVQPRVPISTSPLFSLTGPSSPTSKKGDVCMAARLPSLVSIIFLPYCSCWLDMPASFAQSPLNSVSQYSGSLK